MGQFVVSAFAGCLSVCGYQAKVARHVSVVVRGLNEHAEPVEWAASDWTARIIQHETDHLNGVLYVDRMDAKTLCTAENMGACLHREYPTLVPAPK